MTHTIIKTDKMKLQLTYTKNQDGTEYLLCNEKDNFYHLPLNNSPILEGVPLLPPLEDDVIKLSYEVTNGKNFANGVHEEIVAQMFFRKGYNKAKEKYKYTEEDLIKAIDMARLEGNEPFLVKHTEDEIIESLQQPKYPVAFECEMVLHLSETWSHESSSGILSKPKTITNSQGLTQLVGKYIY